MLGSRLRSLRIRHRRSIQDVACATGFPRTYIILCEQGDICPSHHLIVQLAACYGMSVAQVLTGCDPAADGEAAAPGKTVPAPERICLRLRPATCTEGELFFRLRTAYHLSRQEMAVVLGVTRDVVRAIELGDRSPDARLLRRYAAYFDIPKRILLRCLPRETEPAVLCADAALLLADPAVPLLSRTLRRWQTEERAAGSEQ